jgi:hypothetical protein
VFGSVGGNTEAIVGGTSIGSYTVGGTTRAFIHTDADGTVDLNTLVDNGAGWVLVSATALNSDGTIVGRGTFNGAPAVFRLTKVATVADTVAPVISSVTADPSSIALPNNALVPVTVTVNATDAVDPAPVCALSSLTSTATTPDDSAISGAFSANVRAVGGRDYTLTVTCTDGSGNASSRSAVVHVDADTTGPAISSLTATPGSIWPPNGALVPVSLAVVATDTVDPSPICKLTGITSTGSTADDFTITGDLAAKLRAIGGRTYTLTVTCKDAAGNSTSAAVAVDVPPDVTAPTITQLSATPSLIWPPNGKMVPVSISVSATDDVDASPVCSLKSIEGAGVDDYSITGAFTALVRADKNKDGTSRVYTLNVTCSDGAGNEAHAATAVTVSNKDTQIYRAVQHKK